MGAGISEQNRAAQSRAEPGRWWLDVAGDARLGELRQWCRRARCAVREPVGGLAQGCGAQRRALRRGRRAAGDGDGEQRRQALVVQHVGEGVLQHHMATVKPTVASARPEPQRGGGAARIRGGRRWHPWWRRLGGLGAGAAPWVSSWRRHEASDLTAWRGGRCGRRSAWLPPRRSWGKEARRWRLDHGGRGSEGWEKGVGTRAWSGRSW
uniref:Uncharacterized protein n=1 Tax=Arundo donax TaxID=35708 RepID=A0A0A8XR41_ARUDO